MKKRQRQPRSLSSSNQKGISSKTALLSTLLWLLAFTTTGPSTKNVRAFVVASDNHGSSSSTPNLPSNLNNQKLQPNEAHRSNVLQRQPHPDTSLYSTIAVPLSQLQKYQQQQQHFLAQEETPLELDFSSTIKTAKIDEDDVLAWASRFTSVEALRKHFGTNENKLWGDLQASTARRLYKTLLPRALLELSRVEELKPEDLAPLAYQARLAAKMYARERCTVPARIAATLFDGFRQWMKYGKFQGNGMTYDQLWGKYAEKILQETEVGHLRHADVDIDDDIMIHRDSSDQDTEDEEEEWGLDECEDHYDEISEQVCRKIIERACVSNEGVDAFVLNSKNADRLQPDQQQLLERIKAQLEQDMYQLLLPDGKADVKHHPALQKREDQLKTTRYRMVKGIAKQRKFWNLQRRRHRKPIEEHLQERSKASLYNRSQPWKHEDTTEMTSSDREDEEEFYP